MDLRSRPQLIDMVLRRRNGSAPGAVYPAVGVHPTVRLWQQCAPELISIIGEGGFQPLYERSVRMAARQHPWLAHDSRAKPGEPPSGSIGFQQLQAKLQVHEALDANEADLASTALFTIFFDMLASLIGDSLTTHLLHCAWRQHISALLDKDFRQ